ncbi:dihydrouridine synthase (Dus) superfamily [Trichinella spiralis]|uniref:dihydrouridine synthase (Dus) superfamily n=1 Tax=Trichinella spiralis TaxID=6334 RepID=UPI0001EFDC25|nr:dihydrouridine synthase (Dus) superfamily [Trichinella spiralis]
MLKHYRGYTIWLLLIISRDTMTNDRTKINIAELFSNSAPLKISAPMVPDNCDDFVKAAEIVYTQCDGVDLNCGCPKRKTLDANCGSALLDNASHLAELIKQSRLRILDSKFSISVKIRIYENLKDTVDLCQKLQSAGITFINVHGRTVEQRHEPVDVEVFKVIKDSLQIPVVANGDVRSLSDVHYYHQHAGVEGVMVARALLENPALFTGADKTPADCFFHWVSMNVQMEKNQTYDFCQADNVPFTRFHRHISFMLEKSLNKSQRAELAEIRDSNQLFTFVSKTVALALLNFGVPLSIPRKLLSVHLFQDCNIISIFLQPNFLQPSIDMACVGVLSNCFFTSSSLILLISISSNVVETVKISGRWHHGSGDPLLTLLAGFGFQKTDPADLEATRGFIFGNITDGMAKPAGYLILIASDWIEEMKTVYRSDNASCKQLMSRLSDLAFERRCFPKNGQDFFRSIPCPVGNICPDEDDRTNVISGYQLTFRIQDVIQARFWYLALVNCILDDACNWVPFNSTIVFRGTTGHVGIVPFRLLYLHRPLWGAFVFDQLGQIQKPSFFGGDAFARRLASVVLQCALWALHCHSCRRCVDCTAAARRRFAFLPCRRAVRVVARPFRHVVAQILSTFSCQKEIDHHLRSTGSDCPTDTDHLCYDVSSGTVAKSFCRNMARMVDPCAEVAADEMVPHGTAHIIAEVEVSTSLRFRLHGVVHLPGGVGCARGRIFCFVALQSICFFANFVAYAAMVHLFWPQSVLQKLLCSNDDFDSSKDSADWDEYEQAIIISSSDR